MHPSVEEAFQQIDAAMFTGDDFEYSDESRARLQYFINRWQRKIDEIDADKVDEALDAAIQRLNEEDAEKAQIIRDSLRESGTILGWTND